MGFEERLQKAIERGKRRGDAQARDARALALNEEEFKRLHSEFRLKLSDRIEKCLERLPQHFPGFRLETVFGERGWGAACSRDDLALGARGQRQNNYSRCEITVRPYSTYHVLNLTAKGTVRNKEVFNRNHFEKLDEADLQTFVDLIDVWVLDYAELYAAAL